MLNQEGDAYEVGGISVPRVSSIIRNYLGPTKLPDTFGGAIAMERSMEAAAKRGDLIHEMLPKMMASVSLGPGPAPIVEEYKKKLEAVSGVEHAEALAELLADLPNRIGPFVVMGSEVPVISFEGEMGYGGSLDISMAQAWASWIVDLKCTHSLNKKYVGLQTTAYARALEKAKLHPLHAPIVQTAAIHVWRVKRKGVYVAKAEFVSDIERLDGEWIEALRKWHAGE